MKKQIFSLALAAVTLSTAPALLPASAFAQAISVNGGAIQGTITDPSGAVVSNAQVSITSPETGYKKDLTTDKSGFYSVGPLNPGNYTVTVTGTGFQMLEVKTVVRTGTATPGSFKLTVGASSTEISVSAGAVQVNTDQGGVSDVITKEQITSLPINGRNFLDVAQIEPGVILQSGETFDPTKAGYSAISVSGVSGRSTRILLDGQDITDETVGTTIFNVSQGAINEFQLNRSTQDVTGDVTSTGQVLVSTQSGTNSYHGQLFYQFQDYRALFASGGASNPPFQRNQFGGGVGGPIIKDKLFFFGNLERIKQDSSTQIPLSPTFAAIQAAHPSVTTPYRETYSTIRLDYNGPFHGHYFARANYNVNAVDSTFGSGFELYANRDNTPGIAGGADFASGRFTHSFRGSYEKFHNLISDASSGAYNPLPGITFQNVAFGLYTGPNDLAPQGTFQSDKQFRYDGTWTRGTHNIRYGYSLNRIQGGGFAAFFGIAPRVRETTGTLLAGGNPSDPFNGYHPSSIVLGNGQGFFTETAGFGLIGGSTGDWRQGAYVADTWKITPNFTLVAGLRWSVDTGRANQDLATPLCSSENVGNFTTGYDPCAGQSASTPIFGLFGARFGNKVKQPYGNFGPQLGFNYAPGGNQKTVFRAAAGIFYENDVFNNTTNARTGLLQNGAFFNSKSVCGSKSLTLPDGTTVTTATANGNTESIAQVCAGSIQSAAPYAIALQQLYQANTKTHALSSNGGYVGATGQVSGQYGAPYQTPYANQFNFGIQREIFKGGVISADYVHNATLKIGQTVDQNHVGSARNFNKTAAQNAINATVAACGVGQLSIALTVCPGLYPNGGGATIADFAANGLDSGNEKFGGVPAANKGLTPNTGAAFAGDNPLLGNGSFILPIGKTGYDALQVVFRQVASHPLPGIVSSNVQVSYALSRIVATGSGAGQGGSDAFFPAGVINNDDPNSVIGRAGLDHKHELNFGGSMRMKYGLQLGLIGHFYSAPPSSLTLDNTVIQNGNIFQSDLNGDGTTGDLLPGTLPGDYMHRVKSTSLQSGIASFNSQYAGQLTPAGQQVVNSGLFTQAQFIAIGGAVRPIATLPQANAINNPAFRTLDVNASYPIPLARFREGLSLEPAIAFYNVGNLANYGTLGSTLPNIDNGTVTNGVNQNASTRSGPNTFDVQNGLRTVRGSGTFDQGGPRTVEFILKLNF